MKKGLRKQKKRKEYGTNESKKNGCSRKIKKVETNEKEKKSDRKSWVDQQQKKKDANCLIRMYRRGRRGISRRQGKYVKDGCGASKSSVACVFNIPGCCIDISMGLRCRQEVAEGTHMCKAPAHKAIAAIYAATWCGRLGLAWPGLARLGSEICRPKRQIDISIDAAPQAKPDRRPSWPMRVWVRKED